MLNKKLHSGVAAVEFAIVLIPMVLLAFGITEYGRAVYQYNTIAKSVRSAVRLLSQQSAGDTAQITIAKNLVVYGSRTAGTTTLVPGLTTGEVTVCDASNCASTHQNQSTGSSAVNLVTVTVTGYSFTPLITLFPSFTFGNISATMRQA